MCYVEVLGIIPNAKIRINIEMSQWFKKNNAVDAEYCKKIWLKIAEKRLLQSVFVRAIAKI